jgi:hypothetical protein
VLASGLPSSMNSKANTLRMRQVNVPPGEWEFTVRTFRRGVHVGDMSAAQLYGRFLGPDEAGIILPRVNPAPWHGLNGPSKNAVWDEDGDRVCEECGEKLPRPEGSGSWARKCDPCWAFLNPKWYRRRQQLRERGYPKRTVADPGEPGSLERLRAVLGEERFQEAFGGEV